MRRTRTVSPFWQLPGGAMAYECAADLCTDIATIVVRGPKGCEWALCPEHWRHLQRQTLGLMEIIRTLDRPTCSRRHCQDEAAAVIDEPDAAPVPVCQRHWTTVTWVTPSPADARPDLKASWRQP
jgi:hypothetical protein